MASLLALPRNLAAEDSTSGLIKLFHRAHLLLQEGVLVVDRETGGVCVCVCV